MRIKSWRQDLDKQATVEAFRKAVFDEAWDLAVRIREANTLPASDWDLSKEFDEVLTKYHAQHSR